MRKFLLKALVYGVVCGWALIGLAETESGEAKNLLKHDFSKTGSNGLPVGYKVYFDKACKGKAAVIQEDGENVVKLEIAEQGKGFLDSTFQLGLKKNKKYVLTVQIKIKDQKYSGRGMHFFYTCVYNTRNNKHIYNKVLGHGDTGGWITVVLPIDTVKNPKLVDSKLLIRAYYVSGTYWLKKPMLVEIPADLELEAHYILDDNKTVPSGLLRLGTLAKLK
jgi:hypothetical protein